jgi:O-antigen ligase
MSASTEPIPAAPHPSSASTGSTRAGTALAASLVAAAFLPVGVANLVLLTVLLCSGWRCIRQGPGWLKPRPHEIALLLFLALMAASSLWTVASPRVAWGHTGHYAQLLLLVLVPRLLSAGTARRTLTAYALAALGVAGLYALRGGGLLPDISLTTYIHTYQGNKSIGLALMLVIGAALCVAFSLDRTRWKAGWLASAIFITLALAWQSPSRTALLMLPLVCIATVAYRTRSWRSTLVALLATTALAVGAYLQSPHRERLDEGLQSATQYDTQVGMATSWGARALMIDKTLGMVRERPLLGHGAGAWLTRWQERVTHPEVRTYATPHNEPVLIASQVGLIGFGLFSLFWAGLAWQAWRAGAQTGTPALVVLTAITLASFANVVLRDSVFALPLLFVLGLALAALGPTSVAMPLGTPTAQDD